VKHCIFLASKKEKDNEFPKLRTFQWALERGANMQKSLLSGGGWVKLLVQQIEMESKPTYARLNAWTTSMHLVQSARKH